MPESAPSTPAQPGRGWCPHHSRASPASLPQSADVSSVPSALLYMTCLHPSPPSINHPRPSGPRGRGAPVPAGQQRSLPQALNYLFEHTTEKHQRIQGKQPRGEKLKCLRQKGLRREPEQRSPSLLGAPPEHSAAQQGGLERKRCQEVAVQMDT